MRMGNDYPLLRDADPEEPSAIDGGPGLLVERESELSELERTLREASASRGSVIVIEASRSAAPQDRGGLAILVDDVHWADTPSLRFLAYLAARLSNLPIALIVTIAPGEDSPDSSAASALQTGPAGTVLRLAPLTTSGVSTLVRDRFPDASREFMSACDRVTRGNPFLVIELLAQVGADQNPP